MVTLLIGLLASIGLFALRRSAWTVAAWAKAATVLTFTFLFLAGLAGLSQGFASSTGPGTRWPLLSRIGERRILLGMLGALCLFIGNGAYLVKELLTLKLATGVTQGPSGQVSPIATYDRFHQEASDSAEARRSEAEVYFRSGSYDLAKNRYVEAAQNFGKSLSALPTMSGHLNLGNSLVILGKLEDAEKAFLAGLTLARDRSEFNADFHLALGSLYMMMGRVDTALQATEEALRRYMDCSCEVGIALAQANIGLLQVMEGRNQEAMRNGQQALERLGAKADPAVRALALYLLGWGFAAEGKTKDAEEKFREVVALARGEGNVPFQAVAMAALALTYMWADRNHDAAKTAKEAEQVIKGMDTVASIVVRMAMCATADSGSLDSVISLCQSALDLNRKTGGNPLLEAALLHGIADTYYQHNKFNEALDFHGRALKIAEQLESRWMKICIFSGKGYALEALRRYDEAMGAYQRALDLAQALGNRTEEGTALGNIGDIAFEKGLLSESIVYYKAALERDPARRGFYLAKLCQAHYKTNQNADAVRFCEAAVATIQGDSSDLMVRLSPDLARVNSVLQVLGNTYYSQKDFARALDAYRHSLNLHGPGEHPGCRAFAEMNIGHVYYMQGKWPDALNSYRSAVEDFRQIGDRRGVADALGSIAIARFYGGDPSGARTAWAQALAAYGEKLTEWGSAVSGVMGRQESDMGAQVSAKPSSVSNQVRH